MNNPLVQDAKALCTIGKGPVPITGGTGKKPPSWFHWTDWRDGKKPKLTDTEIEDFFSRPEVVCVGVILDKSCFVVDYEGEGRAVQWKMLVRRGSQELQDALKQTRHTRTPHEGGHIFVLLDPDTFPDGIQEMVCWQLAGQDRKDKKGSHALGSGEIRVLSQNKYAIEAGIGYEPINGGCLLPIRLNAKLSEELVNLYSAFRDESYAIRSIVNGNAKKSILHYWTSDSMHRQDLALAISGMLWHDSISEETAYHLIYYIAKVTHDEESDSRLGAVKYTYKNGRECKEIAGYSKLLPLLDGNKAVIKRIQDAFSSLGYTIRKPSVTIVRRKDKSFSAEFDLDNDENRGSHRYDGMAARAREALADLAVSLAKERIKDLFVDKFDLPFATIAINGRLEILPIRRNKFKKWMCKIFYEEFKKALNPQARDSALGILEADAIFSDKVRHLALRISDGHIDISGTAENPISQRLVTNEELTYYYDLTNKLHQVVKITKDGWTMEESHKVPQMFYRLQSQQAQVTPTHDYPPDIFDKFMDLMNTLVKNDKGHILDKQTRKLRLLLKCYIIALFVPNIGRVILLLYGEKGSAKTALMELIRKLVDPGSVLTLTFPRSITEIVQQLSHNFIAFYDNVSVVRDWLSDILCRASTGTGFSKRELYSDDEDVIYEFIRSVGLSSIHLPGSKPDLLDRSLIIKLHFIDKKFRRKYVADIIPKFEALKPQLLGYIFDILAKVLKVKAEGGIKLETRSRMADWEDYCEIISRCMGYDDNEFVEAYADNIDLQTDLVIEDRPVARAIIKLVEELPEGQQWEGSNTDLLAKLNSIAISTNIDISSKERMWPKSASSLSFRLSEVKPNLRELGIEIYETRHSRTRLKTLHIYQNKEVCRTPFATSAPLAPSKSEDSERENKPNANDLRKNANDLQDYTSFANTQTSLAKPEQNERENPDPIAQSSPANDANGADAVLHPSFDWSIDQVQIVNVDRERCDAFGGRNWPKGLKNLPLCGMSGYLGNPFEIGKDENREECHTKYENWLDHGTEVIDGRDPVEYRRKAFKELPGHYKWGCFCAPNACHLHILKKWMKKKLAEQGAT